MRKDGDRLIEHVSRASEQVLLCSPFIKVGVLKRLLASITPTASVKVITRWHAEEIAAGVSDLGVFDLVAARPGATLLLLDNLHAKLYLADHAVLAGSANLTATALGWCAEPNVELLLDLSAADEAVRFCLERLVSARLATAVERDALQAIVDGLTRAPLPDARTVDEELASLWLPRLGAPQRLFGAYTPTNRDRLTSFTIESADRDLAALDIAPNLSETAFNLEVGRKFSAMPAIVSILDAASGDITDADGAQLVRNIAIDSGMTAEVQWQIVREWVTYFLDERYEIAPQSFVTRLRPGAGRK